MIGLGLDTHSTVIDIIYLEWATYLQLIDNFHSITIRIFLVNFNKDKLKSTTFKFKSSSNWQFLNSKVI